MIWFILIYVITIILLGIISYCDMDKGETLEQYFRGLDIFAFIILFLCPVFNTVTLIFMSFQVLFSNIWDKIKYWKK